MNSVDIHHAARQREVRLIRHGEKNASTAAVDPNQLTENGRRDALAYGAGLRATPTLEVYCSTDAEGRAVDRSHDTGWYVHAGYAGLEYAAANTLFRSDSVDRQQFVPGLEARLQQRVPQRILDEYRAKIITRAQAMEQCYQMLAPATQGVDSAEKALMLEGAQSYLAAIVYHLIDRAPPVDERTHVLDLLAATVTLTLAQSNPTPQQSSPCIQPYSAHTIVLVGHDPNIGGLQQHLEQAATLTELAPLQGIKVTRIPPLWLSYSFVENTEPLGFFSSCLEGKGYFRHPPDRSDIRRVL